MDRFSWKYDNGLHKTGEILVTQQRGLRLYDGEDKTNFDNGNLKLTSHSLIWEDQKLPDRRISLSLALISKVKEHSSGLMKSAKLFVYLNPPPADRQPGPFDSSSYAFIKLSFRNGGHIESSTVTNLQADSNIVQSRIQRRGPGILGIERNLEEKSRATDTAINQAFKDLDALMEKAKEMVALADRFASKIEERKGTLTEDETILFKSYLLSVGISNPVTRETHGSGTSYHKKLAKELEIFLSEQLKIEGGMMTLTDVYCRFNRARGMELVSPEDLLNASQLFQSLGLSLRLRSFSSGVFVIQSSSHSDDEVIHDTREKLFSNSCLTADQLSKILGISVMLAKERLLFTEQVGMACRDDSVEGLKFYPNMFLQTAVFQ
ncbi:vacuolar protein-sorting-associated protein 36-like isoform X2 [Xenia sp. Carnegie-2017]|uniref:vacuolar protein-sorting-associated protein 36-like isoform X2 n=1 Tax=Xenia sp. Carnegie-2017 TaxID=2897299 RepID=UPI001F033C8B|nr:vacuolar protein-sorting-associated protein 36-like isoform X2 [Xenia sp. Carnegie-2017]